MFTIEGNPLQFIKEINFFFRKPNTKRTDSCNFLLTQFSGMWQYWKRSHNSYFAGNHRKQRTTNINLALLLKWVGLAFIGSEDYETFFLYRFFVVSEDMSVLHPFSWIPFYYVSFRNRLRFKYCTLWLMSPKMKVRPFWTFLEKQCVKSGQIFHADNLLK